MIDRRDYLLRNANAVRNYSLTYKDFIARFESAYLKWFNTMPMMEWQRLELLPGTEQAVIGLICMLHQKGIINITFRDNSLSEIRREPATAEESEAYLRATSFKWRKKYENN